MGAQAIQRDDASQKNTSWDATRKQLQIFKSEM